MKGKEATTTTTNNEKEQQIVTIKWYFGEQWQAVTRDWNCHLAMPQYIYAFIFILISRLGAERKKYTRSWCNSEKQKKNRMQKKIGLNTSVNSWRWQVNMTVKTKQTANILNMSTINKQCVCALFLFYYYCYYFAVAARARDGFQYTILHMKK